MTTLQAPSATVNTDIRRLLGDQADGIDCDRFDALCDHLIIIDTTNEFAFESDVTQRVVSACTAEGIETPPAHPNAAVSR